MKNIFSFLYFFLAVYGFCLAQPEQVAIKADELLTAYSDQGKFSGTVLIAKGNDILFQKAYGYADQANKQANTLQTEFRAGSLTKMFTSAAILQLVQASKLSLSDPLSKFVPQFENADHIQIRHLLSHTSGIKGSAVPPLPTTLSQAVARYKAQPSDVKPGERFEYNNFNYILLSYIVEQISGLALPDLLKKHVFAKAGMYQSGLDYTGRSSTNKALGYVTNPATGKWEAVSSDNVAMASGAGSLYTTVGDLFLWSQALAKHSVLSESILQDAFRPVAANYGLGYIVDNNNGRTQVSHSGSIEGFIANFITFPKEKTTIIYLSNYRDTDGRQLAKDLTALVFNEPYTLPKLKKEVALSADVLNRYVGVYQLNEHFKVTISMENNKLYALAPGDQEKIEFTPESDTKFFLKGPQTEVEFFIEKGKVQYMFINLQGGQKLIKVS